MNCEDIRIETPAEMFKKNPIEYLLSRWNSFAVQYHQRRAVKIPPRLEAKIKAFLRDTEKYAKGLYPNSENAHYELWNAVFEKLPECKFLLEAKEDGRHWFKFEFLFMVNSQGIEHYYKILEGDYCFSIKEKKEDYWC